jgi:hypothetical protein
VGWDVGLAVLLLLLLLVVVVVAQLRIVFLIDTQRLVYDTTSSAVEFNNRTCKEINSTGSALDHRAQQACGEPLLGTIWVLLPHHSRKHTHL